jgi:hypothetical protein
MNEEDQMRAEIEKRKQRARDLKIVDNVFKLYQEHLRHLNSDFDHDKNSMPSSVTRVVASSRRSRGDSVKKTEIVLAEKTYTFSFTESSMVMPDNEVWTSGQLAIESEGMQMLELRCSAEDERYVGRTWHVSDVTAFIEGAWVEEINRFAQQVFSLAGQRAAKFEDERKRKELEELKRKFGL